VTRVLGLPLKSNLPTRIAFRLGSSAEYGTLLGDSGAEKLEGQGNFYYHSPASPHLIRSRGLLITDEEIRKLIAFVSTQSTPAFDPSIQNQLESSAPAEEVTEEDEILVEKCLEIIRQEKRASTSMLQRRLRLGYTLAARVVDILERRGILGPGDGAKPREILVDLGALV
jgi:S-DNA-T family DNA segregation ATPase FtsK/SpoIIIE